MTAPKIRTLSGKSPAALVRRVDAAAVRVIAAHRRPPLDVAARAANTIGRGGVAWSLLVAAVAGRARGAKGASAAVPVLGAFLLSAGLARLLGRPRPFEGSTRVSPVGEKPSGPAFPSDQAASAAAAAAQLSRFVPSGRSSFWAAVVAHGASRVYVAAHYPSDVAAGAALGRAVARFWTRATEQG